MPLFDNEIETTGGDSIGGLLQEFGNLLQTSLVQSLFEKGATDSLKLSQSIQFDVQFISGTWRFELSMEDYGKFIDQGVQGVGGERKSKGYNGEPKGSGYLNVAPQSPFKYKEGLKPSARHFDLWARQRGLNPFAARESVFRKGLKPNHFYSDIVDDNLINELVRNLELKGAKSLELEIADSLKGTFK